MMRHEDGNMIRDNRRLFRNSFDFDFERSDISINMIWTGIVSTEFSFCKKSETKLMHIVNICFVVSRRKLNNLLVHARTRKELYYNMINFFKFSINAIERINNFKE